MEKTIITNKDIQTLIEDVAKIKEILLKQEELEEEELTEYATNELEKARQNNTKISHEDAKKMLFAQ